MFTSSAKAQKAVLERYRKHFECVLVDEYQDTTFLQDKIVECLKRDNNLFIVGDVQQSIYGFRSADPQIF